MSHRRRLRPVHLMVALAWCALQATLSAASAEAQAIGSQRGAVVEGERGRSLQAVLADMAQQLAGALEQQKLARVGVLEFIDATPAGELLGADFGLLGRYCAEEFQRQLAEAGAGKLEVLDRRRLQTALAEQSFGLAELASPEALRRLSEGSGGLPALALGRLRGRSGRSVSLECRLSRTDRGETVGAAGDTALLTDSEWAMLGRSAQLTPEDRRLPPPGPDSPVRPLADVLIDRLDHRSQGAHPLLDPSFPFPLKIMVQRSGQVEERKPVARGNDLFVPLAKGEVYEIWVENRTGGLVLMRLLVDGINTLPERGASRAVVVEPSVTHLAQARPWHLDPAEAKLFAVRGFVQEVGEQGKLREFRVADAQDSLAARRRFTDQIGLITAAFYRPQAGSARGLVGTEEGNEKGERIGRGARVQVGPLLAVVHLRYVEPAALEAAAR